jgi:hypothetical protein
MKRQEEMRRDEKRFREELSKMCGKGEGKMKERMKRVEEKGS